MRTNITMMAAPILLSLNQKPKLIESAKQDVCDQLHSHKPPTEGLPVKGKKKHKKKIKIESISRVTCAAAYNARIITSPIVVPNKALRLHR